MLFALATAALIFVMCHIAFVTLVAILFPLRPSRWRSPTLSFLSTAAQVRASIRGPEWHRTLSLQIEAAAGIPTITASTAVLAALSALKARTVFMASPYPESVNEAEVQFLNAHGFRIIGLLSFGCTRSKETVQVTHQTIVSTIVERRSEYRDADVLFVSCTGLRAADVVEALETELSLPVVTSNSATLWLALCRLGVDCGSVKLGRLFRQVQSGAPRTSSPSAH
jgi:maleate isomerase